KTRDQGADRDRPDPGPLERGGTRPRLDLLDMKGFLGVLVFIGQDPRQAELQAVAASIAICSCARATSSTSFSMVSMSLSQSKRRAHSKARSPVTWFSLRSSSSRLMPAA